MYHSTSLNHLKSAFCPAEPFSLKDVTPLVVFSLLFLAILFSQNIQALTTREYLKRVPEYIRQLPGDDPQTELARQRLNYFSPFLVRLYSIIEEQQGSVTAESCLESASHWIASQPGLAYEEAFTYLVSLIATGESQDEQSLLTTRQVSFTTPMPAEPDVSSYTKTILARLARFSLDPASGGARLVLHGSRALQAHFFTLYGEDKAMRPADYDFKILREDIPALLEELAIPAADRKEIKALSLKPASQKPSTVQVNLGSLILHFEYIYHSDGLPTLLTIKLLLLDEGEGATSSLLETLDLFFVSVLPEASFMLFEGIGFVPVLDPPALLMSMKEAPEKPSYLVSKHHDRIQLWQQLEQQYQQLTDWDTRQELMAWQLITAPSPDTSATSPAATKPKSRKIKKRKLQSATLPIFFDQLTRKSSERTREEIRQELRRKRHIATAQRTQGDKSLSTLQRWLQETGASIDELESLEETIPKESTRSESLATHLQRFEKVVERINLIWSFQQKVENSVFAKDFSDWSQKSYAHKRTKTRYHMHLHQYQQEVIQALQRFVAVLARDPGHRQSPELLNLMAQAKLLMAELVIGRSKQEPELPDMVAMSTTLMLASAIPEDLLIDLFKFLITSYSELGKTSALERERDNFLTLVNQWAKRLLYVNGMLAHLTESSFWDEHPELRLQYSAMQLQLFGGMLGDLGALTTFYIDQLKKLSHHYTESALASLTTKEQEGQQQLNQAFREFLASQSWYQVYDEHSQLPPEKVRGLLAEIEHCTLSDHSHGQAIAAIRQHWQGIEEATQKELEAAQAAANQLYDELKTKETALQKAREALAAERRKKEEERRKEEEQKKQDRRLQNKGQAKQTSAERSKPASAPAQPPARWRVEQKKADQALASKQYKKAQDFYRNAMKEAPAEVMHELLVQHAEASRQLIAKGMEEMRETFQKIILFHQRFEDILATDEPKKWRYVSQDELIKTAGAYTTAWEEIELPIKTSLADQERALEAIKSYSSKTGDNDFHRIILTRSIDAINTFLRQTLDSRERLQETFQARRQWLKRKAKPSRASEVTMADFWEPSLHSDQAPCPEASLETSHADPDRPIKKATAQATGSETGTSTPGRSRRAITLPVMSRVDEISDLSQTISGQKKKHEALYKHSTRILQSLNPSQPPALLSLPVTQYQEFPVPGDGDCFFTAIAIAMNQVHGTSYDAGSIRKKIHRLLKRVLKVIASAANSPQLQQEILLLLGLDFDTLQVTVQENILLASAATSECAAGDLQQYGQITFATLLLLSPEGLSAGALHTSSPEVHNYGYTLWLTHAPNLLAALVQSNAFNLQHWPSGAELQGLLASGQNIPPTLQHTIGQTQPSAILSHTGLGLSQHFQVAVLSTAIPEIPPEPAPPFFGPAFIYVLKILLNAFTTPSLSGRQ